MPSAICPYLGLLDDPDTCLAFPTERNSCQRTVPVESITLEHQATFCLTYKYTECQIYKGETRSAINMDVAREKRNRLLRRGCILIWLAVVIVGIIALIPILSNYQSQQTGQGSAPDGESMVLPPVEADTPTATLDVPSATFDQVIPTLVPSPTRCFPPAGWVPYVLISGDDVGLMAQAVGYSIEDLQRANCGANLLSAQSGDAIFLPYVPTTTPDPAQLYTPTNTMISIVIINTSTPTPTLTPVPPTATRYYPPTATKPPKSNPPTSRPPSTPPESRP